MIQKTNNTMLCVLILCMAYAGCSESTKPTSHREVNHALDLGSLNDDQGRSTTFDATVADTARHDMSVSLVMDLGAMTVDAHRSDDGRVVSDAHIESRADLGKSFKRGIAYGFDSLNDFDAISTGVSWWYNWSPRYNQAVADRYADYQMDWVPMTWNGNNPDEIRAFLQSHPNVKYLLTYNEPNFTDQANMTPSYAASLWPVFEDIAAEFELKLVGPAVNFCGGCVVVDGEPIASDYIVWLDQFFESFRRQFGREPMMDFTALHWYDFGIQEQVERIVARYQKPVWVTEFALWRSEEWATDEFERNWLLETVDFLEQNPMVYRYAWFTGRRPDFPKINLFGRDGELTPLGRAYVEAPY